MTGVVFGEAASDTSINVRHGVIMANTIGAIGLKTTKQTKCQSSFIQVTSILKLRWSILILTMCKHKSTLHTTRLDI